MSGKKCRILIMAIAFLGSLGLHASRYEVFKIKGKVMIENGGAWTALSVHSPLEARSRIMIEAGSSIGIKDTATKQIYYGTKQGETSVVNVIRDAKTVMRDKTSSIVDAIVNSSGGSVQKRRGVLGVTNRGGAISNDNDGEMEIIPGTLEHFIKALARGEVPENPDSPQGFRWRISLDPDSVASYEISLSPSADGSDTSEIGRQDEFYYINVLRIDESKVPQFIFQNGHKGENLSIARGEKIFVDWFQTIFDPQARYLLFVSESTLEPELLQNTMNSIRNGKLDKDHSLPLSEKVRHSAVWAFDETR